MSEAPANPAAKAGDTAQIGATVAKAIQEISHIATLPEVTMRIIHLVEDPDSTAQDLNKVITNDPALGARILKVVNSAFYGLPGQIGSINRAIVLLGLNAVKNIAIAASLAKLFRGGKICNHFDARDLWTHSVATATGTRLLAEKVGLGLPDEAFLAGLIHDIGIMVEIQAKRAQFAEVVDLAHNDPSLKFREVEMLKIGATHEHFGAGLCKLWKFPTSFAFVTGFHHHPWDLPSNSRALTSLVHVADILASRLDHGIPELVEHDQVRPDILDEIKMTNAQLDELVEKLPAAMEEAKSIFQNPGL